MGLYIKTYLLLRFIHKKIEVHLEAKSFFETNKINISYNTHCFSVLILKIVIN